MSDLIKIKDVPSAITTAIDAIQRFAKYILVPCGVVVFAHDSWLKQFRLLELKNSSFGMWVAILFLVSVSIVIIDLLKIIANKVKNYNNNKRIKKNFEKFMYSLTESELEIVYLIYKNDAYSFEISNASITKLTSLGVVFHSNISQQMLYFSYSLQPTTHGFLLEHTKFFDDFITRKKKAIFKEIEEIKTSYNINFDYSAQYRVKELESMIHEFE